MAKLTGLQIQKLLPKTNCKECGSNTCLAFAMKLAAQKANLSECPYASEETKQVLGAASEPPVRSIVLGKDKELRLGEETVLYRHEKSFVNQTLFAVNINDTDMPEAILDTISNIRDYSLERVGEQLKIDMICLTNLGEDIDNFASLSEKIFEKTRRPMILRSTNIKALEKGAAVLKGTNSIISAATSDTIHEFQRIASDNNHALVITASSLDELADLSEKSRDKGFNNIILQFPTNSLLEEFQFNSIARRLAIKDNYKPLGYPVIKFIEEGDILEDTAVAVTEICKYGGICVLPSYDPAQLVSLMTLRLNIYTDPQKPIQVDPKVYPIGDPNEDSPVFVTTNFSLTYFIVSGEIENSGISAWLVVPECEGMSVLTAWAAGKFSGAHISKFIKEIKLEDQVRTRQIIIPGYVAQISGELEEALPGWNVKVGPQEAGDIESYVKAMKL